MIRFFDSIQRWFVQGFFNLFLKDNTTVNFRMDRKLQRPTKVEIRIFGWNVGETEIK